MSSKSISSPVMKFSLATEETGDERRQHRRHDLEQQGLKVDRWEGSRRGGKEFGTLVDLSAGGVRIRTSQSNIRTDHQIRVRLTLPDFAGIAPFIDTSSEKPSPKREWIGWMTVSRVINKNGETEVAGRLVDMDEMDRGMLKLYLSTQPLAA